MHKIWLLKKLLTHTSIRWKNILPKTAPTGVTSRFTRARTRRIRKSRNMFLHIYVHI